MEDPEILENILDEMEEECKKIFKWVKDTKKQDLLTLGKLETRVQEGMRHINQKVLESIIGIIGSGYIGAKIPCCEEGELKFVNYRLRTILTVLGQVEIKRAYYWCKKCGKSLIPLDKQLKIGRSSLSSGVDRITARIAAEAPFGDSKELLWELTGIRISKNTIRRTSEQIGKQIKTERGKKIQRLWEKPESKRMEMEQSSKKLIITMDGTMVNLSKEGWKEAKLGAIYDADGEKRETSYVGNLKKCEEFGKDLYAMAVEKGVEQTKDKAVIGDGAKWIWELKEEHCPDAIEIVDFYHASEKINEVAKITYGENNPKTLVWSDKQVEYLLKGKISEVKKSLIGLRTKNKDTQEKIRQTIHYFEGNERRMKYPTYRRLGYPIGSGVVEGGCKHVIGARLKQAGMRWSREGAESILQLRIHILNNGVDKWWKESLAA